MARFARPLCRSRRLLSALFVALLLLSAGCARSTGGVTIAGSTSVQPFAEQLAEEYSALHPAERINVQGGGSSAGIEAVLSGAAQVGMSSRDLTGDEKQLVEVEIARDAIAVVVHKDNPVRALSLEQVRDIFAGRITRWSDVGGPPRPIVVVTREEGSGTRGAFQEMVMGKGLDVDAGALVQDSNGAVRQLVAGDPNAIGYISLGLVDGNVEAVSIDGVEPSAESVAAGAYRIVRPFLFVLASEPEGATKSYIDYVLGPEGQQSLAREGLLSPSDAR